MYFGHITINRQIMDWRWYTHHTHRSVFIHCLIKANFKDNYLGKTLIKRGSFVTSGQRLSDELGYTKRTILRALEDLEGSGELSRKSNNKGTMISITKYDSFQGGVTQGSHQSTPPSIRKVPTNNNVNNVNNTYSEKLVRCFEDNEIITWLKKGNNKKSQDALILLYKKDFIIKEINNAYCWVVENNKKRKAGTFLSKWFENSNHTNKFNLGMNPLELELKKAEMDLLNS